MSEPPRPPVHLQRTAEDRLGPVQDRVRRKLSLPRVVQEGLAVVTDRARLSGIRVWRWFRPPGPKPGKTKVSEEQVEAAIRQIQAQQTKARDRRRVPDKDIIGYFERQNPPLYLHRHTLRKVRRKINL